jgi:hypothetical protein
VGPLTETASDKFKIEQRETDNKIFIYSDCSVTLFDSSAVVTVQYIQLSQYQCVLQIDFISTQTF